MKATLGNQQTRISVRGGCNYDRLGVLHLYHTGSLLHIPEVWSFGRRIYRVGNTYQLSQ